MSKNEYDPIYAAIFGDPANCGLLASSTPEARLADLIGRELAVYPDPAALRRFIERHWSKVSALAHKIHDEVDRYASVPMGDG